MPYTLSMVERSHRITHTFTWPMPAELTMHDAKKLGLVKGVLMREGELKDGRKMTRDNVMKGGGAMRASIITGQAMVDVDHIKDKLPDAYVKKYGDDVNDDYPPAGHIIDADVVEAEDGKVEVQAIMALNQWLYKAVGNGHAKGNSVEDYYRKCEGGEACSYEGSTFMMNTVVLEEVPNSNGTWVEHVTEDDIGTIIKHQENAKHTKAPIWDIINKKLHAEEEPAEEEDITSHPMLASYMKDGIWLDGADSIVEFLTKEKEMDIDTATAMAEFMHANPKILSQHQLEHLSSSDLIAWWTHWSVKQDIASLTAAVQTHARNLHLLRLANPEIGSKIAKYVADVKKAEDAAK